MADGRYSVVPTNLAPVTPPEEEEKRPLANGRYSVASDPSSAFLPGLAQGASMEWGDELVGWVAGQEKKRAYQDWVRQAQEQSPGTYQGGKFLGSAATAMLPAGALMRGAGAAPTLWSMARQGAALGGGLGAVEGLGEAEGGDPWAAAGKTALGAGVGAAAGAVLPPIAYGLLSGARAGGRVLGDFARGESQSALRKTEEALRRQATAPEALSGRLVADATPAVQNANPEVLADVLRGYQAGQTATDIAAAVNATRGTNLSPQQVGRLNAGFTRANPVPRDLIALSEEVGGGEAGRSGLTNLMQGVTTIGGRGREIAMRNMSATMEAAPERMAQRLSGEMGDLDFRASMATREARRRQQAGEAYGAARAVDEASGQPLDLEPILSGYSVRAQTLGGETGSRIAQGVEMMSGLRPGSTELGVNNLERYHQARRTLDRMIRSVNTGPNPDWNAGRILRQMRDDLNTQVYAANPAFAAADRQFATNMAREEAMGLGRDMNLRSGAKQDELLANIRRLEARHPQHAEELRDNFMQGMLRRLADEIEISGGVPSRWTQPLTGGIRPAPQAALREGLGAPLPGAPVVRGRPAPYAPGQETAQGVTNILGDEARLKKIFTDIWGNSKTAERMAAQEDLRALPSIAAELATGGLGNLKNAITKRLVLAITARNAEQIARIVTETDPRTLYLALHDIQRMGPAIRRGERAMAIPAHALGAAAGQFATGR